MMNIRKIVAARVAVGALLSPTAYARTARTAQILVTRGRQHPPRHSYCTSDHRLGLLLTSLDLPVRSVN